MAVLASTAPPPLSYDGDLTSCAPAPLPLPFTFYLATTIKWWIVPRVSSTCRHPNSLPFLTLTSQSQSLGASHTCLPPRGHGSI
eukprot:2316599-Ditylum_brightwellii.AAC.1